MDNDEKVLKVLEKSIKLPLVKVNRREFLVKEFGSKIGSEDLAGLIEFGPAKYFTKSELEKVAKQRVNILASTSAAASFAAGLPGGFAMAATIPADVLQFFGMSLRLAQELGYIYGVDDFWNDSDELTEDAKNVLLLYLGVMFGVAGAGAALRAIAPNVANKVARNIMQKPLAKGVIYPMLKKISSYVAKNTLTKKGLAGFATKAIPIVGGVISGGLTLATLKPMGKKLRIELAQMVDYSAMDYENDLTKIKDVTNSYVKG